MRENAEKLTAHFQSMPAVAFLYIFRHASGTYKPDKIFFFDSTVSDIMLGKHVSKKVEGKKFFRGASESLFSGRDILLSPAERKKVLNWKMK